MRLGLIGYGTIAQALVTVLARERAMPGALAVLVRPGTEARVTLPGATVVGDAAGLLNTRPGLVIECAGQGAVGDHAVACLASGVDTVVASIGALSDDALHARLVAAAREGGSRMILPAGAVGAVDLLSALRPSGIEAVRYSGSKPPLAWAGTPAEELLDLSALHEATTFFTGTAREAARLYPRNANVAATLALAGAGFDATMVRLVADPGVTRNVHQLSVRAGAADFDIRIEGKPAPDNPKTSLATVYSLAREVLNRTRKVAI